MREELWISDSAGSKHMSLSSDHMLNYRQCRECFVVTACGSRLPVVGLGDLDMAFRSDTGLGHVTMHYVQHVPALSQHIHSLRVVTTSSHE